MKICQIKKEKSAVKLADIFFLIGLDRAAKRNAFDSHMIKDLSLALTEYENNDALRCAIVLLTVTILQLV